jgi:hypothetical protein
VIVVKFWLQISQEEQLRRFKEREQIAFKRFKITEEDWRNREKWDAYQLAICDMVERTSTGEVPWTLVESNDKNYARVKILQTLCDAVESALEGKGGKTSGSKKAKRKNKAAVRLAALASTALKTKPPAKTPAKAAPKAAAKPAAEVHAKARLVRLEIGVAGLAVGKHGRPGQARRRGPAFQRACLHCRRCLRTGFKEGNALLQLPGLT